MRRIALLTVSLMFFISSVGVGQQTDQKVQDIVNEATDNSHLKGLAHELMDVIGPRLVGTPQMKEAHDWAVDRFKSWDISARNEEWGEWKGWERGITHIDLLEPRVVSLDGMQLAWSPVTPDGGVKAGIKIIPEVADSSAFQQWLPKVKGKFVMVSMPQPTGRPDSNWEEYATDESFQKMKDNRESQRNAWKQKMDKTGYNKIGRAHV